LLKMCIIYLLACPGLEKGPAANMALPPGGAVCHASPCWPGLGCPDSAQMDIQTHRISVLYIV